MKLEKFIVGHKPYPDPEITVEKLTRQVTQLIQQGQSERQISKDLIIQLTTISRMSKMG